MSSTKRNPSHVTPYLYRVCLLVANSNYKEVDMCLQIKPDAIEAYLKGVLHGVEIYVDRNISKPALLVEIEKVLGVLNYGWEHHREAIPVTRHYRTVLNLSTGDQSTQRLDSIPQ